MPKYKHQKLAKSPTPERRIGIAKKLTVLAIGALSLLGTVAANQNDAKLSENDGLLVSATSSIGDLSTKVNIGLQDVIPGVSSAELPGVKFTIGEGAKSLSDSRSSEDAQKTDESEAVAYETKIQLMEWAELFDVDPAAVESLGGSIKEVKHTVEKIKELIDQGYSIDQIEFQGHASDEDDTAWNNGGDNPGFGIKDPKNVRLANVRAKAIMAIFQSKLQGSLGASETSFLSGVTTMKQGEEVEDPALASEIVELASRKGISAQDLVVQYNRGDRANYTRAELSILDGLRENRFVSIVVHAHRELESPNHVVDDGYLVTEEGGDRQISIVIVPIIIPFFRRNKVNSAATTYPGTTEPVIKPKKVKPVPQLTPKNSQIKPPQWPAQKVTTNIGYSRAFSHRKQPTTHNGGHTSNGGYTVARSGRRAGASKRSSRNNHS